MSISLGFRRFLYRHSETNFLSVAREYPRHSDFPNVLCALFRRNIRFSAYLPKADRLPVSLRGICARVQVPLCRLPSRQCVSRKNLPPRQARCSHGNLLDDGLLLWNNTNDEWENIFASRFSMIRYTEIYYEEYEQSNRMYLLIKQ